MCTKISSIVESTSKDNQSQSPTWSLVLRSAAITWMTFCRVHVWQYLSSFIQIQRTKVKQKRNLGSHSFLQFPVPFFVDSMQRRKGNSGCQWFVEIVLDICAMFLRLLLYYTIICLLKQQLISNSCIFASCIMYVCRVAVSTLEEQKAWLFKCAVLLAWKLLNPQFGGLRESLTRRSSITFSVFGNYFIGSE